MFYYLDGMVAEVLPYLAVIDCGGVGYACKTTNNTLAHLKKGQRGKLYTYLNVGEDVFDLYGFATQSELNTFKLLIGVSGVGPKAALAILSTGTPDALAMASNIQAVMNLADSDALIESCIAANGLSSPYYQSLFEAGKVKALNLGVDFTAADFKSGLAEGLRFLSEYEGPYLVHCNEGKDRAGFASALLECLMGATYEEVVADYMTTYVNYYHLEAGGEQYEAVKNSNIVSILTTITGAKEGADLSKVDLAAAAADYIRSAGLTQAELDALQANLSKDYTLPTEETPAESPEETPAEKPAGQTPPQNTYTIASGDCLWSIAQKLYGTGTRWPELYEANRTIIHDPNQIQIGQVLTVPAA